MKNLIKVERARHDLSQAALAKKVNVTRQTIHAIEKGRFVPSTVLALKICHVFNIRLEELFELEDSDWE